MSEKPSRIPENASPKRKYIHELVLEFRDVLKRSNYQFPESTNAIVVLSGPLADNIESVESVRSPENISRIAFDKIGFGQLAAKKSGKNLNDLTQADLSAENLPLFIINAPTGQKEILKQAALEAGVPETMLHIEDCLPRDKANTNQILPKGLDREIIGVPFEEGQFNVYRRVRGEIQRIVKYSAQEKNPISRDRRNVAQ